MVDFSLIIPAAGVGRRSGQSLPKQYVSVLNKPILGWTVRAFAELPSCGQIIIPVDPEWRSEAERAVGDSTRISFVDGGNERQDSIRNGLSVIEEKFSIVLVHDAVRPVVTAGIIERVVEAAAEHGAAIPTLPIAETVKRVRGGDVLETLSRDELFAVQTPQGFSVDLLRKAYEDALEKGIRGTDDASLVEALGERVVVVPGEQENIK